MSALGRRSTKARQVWCEPVMEVRDVNQGFNLDTSQFLICELE